MAVAKLNKALYRVEPEWASLPNGMAFTNVSAVCASSTGKIYVLQRSDPFMLVFTSEGKLIDVWRNASISDGHYVSCAPDGNVYVVDRDNHRVVVLDVSGRIVRVIGDDPERSLVGPLNHPTDVAFAANGDLFVSDGYGNTSVHRFEQSGNLIFSWGTPGTEPGQFATPHSVVVDQLQRVWVADRENNRLQIFDADGSFIKEVKNVHRPMKIHADGELIYVTDQVPSLMVFDLDGNRLGRCRTLGTFGHGVTTDGDKNIYIAAMTPDRIAKLVPLDGGVKAYGEAAGFLTP